MASTTLVVLAALCSLVAGAPWQQRRLPEFSRCQRWGIQCTPGTRCVGWPGLRRCMRPVPLGGKCVLPYRYCARDVCDGGKCKEVVQVGGSCSRVNAVCEEGTECNNTGVDAVCVKSVMIVGKGESCDGRTTKCEPGHFCDGGKCKEIVAAGRSCARVNVVCEQGTECNNTGIDSVCVKSTTTVGQGETCDGKTTKCAQGLVCSDGKCKEIVSAGRSCTRVSVVCEDGSACNNTGVDAVCVWCPTPGVPCSF